MIIRPATPDDLAAIEARAENEQQRSAERIRYDAQENGEGLLLVAWDGDELRGRVRLRFWSKYIEVIDELGEFPEINALDAWPTGTGAGTKIIAECERIAVERGDKQIGIGVVLTNTAARRLYERLGYEYWGEVIDDGDAAAYLVKNIP